MTIRQSVDKFETDVKGFEEDVRTWWEKFKANVSYYFHWATSIVNTFWIAVLGWWASLGKAGQTDLIGQIASPYWVTAFLVISGIASHYIAKGWPQPATAAKAEIKQVESMAKAAAMDAAQPMEVRAAKAVSADLGPDTMPADNKTR